MLLSAIHDIPKQYYCDGWFKQTNVYDSPCHHLHQALSRPKTRVCMLFVSRTRSGDTDKPFRLDSEGFSWADSSLSQHTFTEGRQPAV